MNLSSSSNPDGISPMQSHEAALHAFHYTSYETVREDPQDNVPILAWELVLGDKIELWPGKLIASANEEATVKQESRQIKWWHTNVEYVIAREVKYAVKKIVDSMVGSMV